MVTNRSSFRLVNLAFALLAACLAAGLVNAQGGRAVSTGSFTLPCEVRWGLAVLPAGEYTYSLSSATPSGIFTVRGNGKAVMVMPNGGISQRAISDHGELIIVRRGLRGTVRSLHVGHLGMTFFYRPPKGERPLLARAPELIQRIPVSAAAK